MTHWVRTALVSLLLAGCSDLFRSDDPPVPTDTGPILPVEADTDVDADADADADVDTDTDADADADTGGPDGTGGVGDSGS